MKKVLLLLIMSLLCMGISETYAAKTRKSAKNVAVKSDTAKVSKSKYDKTFNSKKSVTARGEFITLHKVGQKIYAEIDKKNFDKRMLLGATISQTSNIGITSFATKASAPIYCDFSLQDSLVLLNKLQPAIEVVGDDLSPLKSVNKTKRSQVLAAFKIFCKSNDKKSIVFEITPLFNGSIPSLNPIPKRKDGMSVTSTLDNSKTLFNSLKSFQDNASIESILSYKVSSSFLGIKVMENDIVTVGVNYSFVRLPEKPMSYRESDSRIGIFLVNKQRVDATTDGLRDFSVLKRWRVEPVDSAALLRGELSDVRKPITFYVDDALPKVWREAAKAGILRWNRAFEAIGLRNAVQALDFPKDDPEFDPDNIKYSCIRYIPVATENAQGPSWIDPESGEIVMASVYLYNNVVKLINSWRFVQTAQVDERVRAIRLGDDVLFESMEYVVAHEVGHCLGFMHNMSASAAYPVEKLRDAEFTQKHGTTSSIMDYARFNYIAQPGDKGVKLTPPDLGEYDYHLIRYAYSVYPEGVDENMELRKMIDEKHGNPVYRYGKQQMSYKCDPTAIEEDLGDDAVKASSYGVKNLKYIASNMDSWIGMDADPDYQFRERKWEDLEKQFQRNVNAVMVNIGGMKLNADPRDELAVPVSKVYQKECVQWILNQISDLKWLEPKKRISLNQVSATALGIKIFSALLKKKDAVLLSSYIASEDKYTVPEFLSDIRSKVFGSSQPTQYEMALEWKYLDFILSPLSSLKGSSKRSLLTFADAYSVDEENTGESPEYEGFGKPGYNWQGRVSVTAIDDTQVVFYDELKKIRQIAQQRRAIGSSQNRAHWESMVLKIDNALSGK